MSEQENGSVRVINVSPGMRTGMLTTGIPFRKGSDFDPAEMDLRIDGRVCGVRDVKRYRHGGVRAVAVDVPLTAPGSSDRELDVSYDQADKQAQPFRYHTAINQMGGAWRVTPKGFNLIRHEWIRETSQTRTARQWLRRGSMWSILDVEFHNGIPTARWAMWAGLSSPMSPYFHETVDAVELEVVGPVPTVYHKPTTIYGMRFEAPHRHIIQIGLSNQPWGDGQALFASGDLLFYDRDSLDIAEMESLAAHAPGVPLLGIHDGWADSEALAPFGKVPWLDEANDIPSNLARALLEPRGPREIGVSTMAVNPGQTGAQPDFGVFNKHLWKAVAEKNIGELMLLERDLLGECRRPTTRKEEDVSPWTLAKHPDSWLIDEIPHHHDWSPDKFGKPANQTQGAGFAGYYQYDAQHYSKNSHLAALVTGSPWALDFCSWQAEIIKSRLRVDCPFEGHNQVVTPRVGRMMHAAAVLYWVTGDEEIVQAMDRRVDVSYRQMWEKGDYLTPPKFGGFWVSPPDPRMLPGKNRSITWENAQLVLGLHAWASVTDNTELELEASKWIEAWAGHAVEHGYRKNEHGAWEAASAIEVREDGTLGEVLWGPFAEWSRPCVQIAAAFGNTRAEEIEADLSKTIGQSEWDLNQ
ncbi:MAG: hypothetical protein ACPGVG_08800 [Mycobacterium sp.]